MLLMYVLWIVFVFGGAFMGVAAILAMRQQGATAGLIANAIVYLGFALYGVPKLLKLVVRSRG